MSLRDMLPVEPAHDEAHHALVHAKLLCERRLGFPRSKARPHISYVLLGQDGAIVGLTASTRHRSTSALGRAVLHVVSLRSQEQVRRIDARVDVAGMQDHLAGGNWSSKQNPRDPVCVLLVRHGIAEDAVILPSFAPLPNPQPAAMLDSNMRHQPALRVAKGALVRYSAHKRPTPPTRLIRHAIANSMTARIALGGSVVQ